MIKKSLLVVLSLAFFASTAEAALVSDFEGKVLVNKGRGFRKVSRPTKLKPGDRVLVRGEGSARVTYGMDCEAIVGPNQSFVVPREGKCQQGAGMTDTDRFVLGSFAIGGAFAIGAGHDKPASP